MADSLFSPYWYRAAALHPRLASSIAIARQTFKGEQWYVLSSAASGRQFRLNSLGYQLVGRFDGQRSVQEIWDVLVRELGNDAPSQHEVLAILSELAAAGMLQSETSPDLGAIFEASRQRRKRSGNRFNVLAFRVPLFDPTPLLDALQGLAWLAFRPLMLMAWLLAAVAGIVLAAMHWDALHAYAGLHLASPRNLLLMWLVYPLIKFLHELGHALAIRRWGGEVREVGVTLFVVMPVPYVDASAASTFPEKHRRMAVSAMGVMVEVFIAALALLVWLNISDGWLREAAFACMVIGGVSTVLVNANPLMRFDGYYVLTDWLEMPGLAARADAWLRYLGERWLLGHHQLRRPPAAERVALLLTVFGLASLVYRVLLLAGMAVWLGGKQLALGLALGAWLLLRFLALPAWRFFRFVLHGQRLARIRVRAVSISLLGAAALLVGVFVLPMPYVTRAQGLVWLPDEARVRNEVDGFVDQVLVEDGQQVRKGQALVQLSNPDLEAERAQLAARIASQQIAYQGALLQQPASAVALSEALDKLAAQLADLDRQRAALQLRSPVDGTVGLPAAKDLPGRYFPRGSVIANVLNPDTMTIRAVLPQTEVDLLRQPVRRIEARIAEARTHTLLAQVANLEPAAGYQLPSPMLGEREGGPFVTDPGDRDGLRTLEPVFIVDLTVPHQPLSRIGGRAWVHIEHPPMPLASQWLRSLRQLLVRQLDSGTPAARS